jgi:hypothetical protein
LERKTTLYWQQGHSPEDGCPSNTGICMSLFLIPKGVFTAMMDVIAKFWRGDDENSNKMHWYAWWKLCYPTNDGGMGFCDFHSFNLALLAK